MNKYRQIVKLHAQGLHNQAIVDAVGSTSQYVSSVLKAEGLKRNDRPVRAELYWQKEAAKRRVSVAVLKRRLLDVIHQDRMIDAILDDEEERGDVGKNKAGHSRPAQCVGPV